MSINSSNISVGKAFAPGHITAFFIICDDAPDPLQKGSKGAGICLSKGVTTTVEVQPVPSSSKGAISIEPEIYFNGKRTFNAITTHRTTQYLLEKLETQNLVDFYFRLIIKSDLELPLGQGFGISGAGALSTALAINDALGTAIPQTELVALAHRSEVELRTGLGDVAAQARGGIPIRIQPGITPHSEIMQLKINSDDVELKNIEILLCVIGPKLDTKTVLTSSNARDLINTHGEIGLKKMLEKPDLEKLFKISYEFAMDAQLISPEVQKALTAVHSENGLASMTMLGNSIFILATPKLTNLPVILEKYGTVYSCKINTTGAKVLTN